MIDPLYYITFCTNFQLWGCSWHTIIIIVIVNSIYCLYYYTVYHQAALN